MSEQIKVEIECPNCSFHIEHSYTKETYKPLFGKCGFCGTLFKWTKTRKAKEIIPQSLKQYIKQL